MGVRVTECIHGFEAGQCDICFPRATAVAERPVPANAPRAHRAAAAPRTAPARASAAGRSAPVPPFGSRRLYHVTHVRNLESILLDGALRSPADGASPDVDVTAPLVRQLRAHADVGDGRHVAEFVPFFLAPDAARWQELKHGASASHWSTAARLADSREFLVLVVEAKRVGTDVVVADGDAASPLTEFTVGDPARAVARAARQDPELATAEVLVPGRVPLDAIALVGVANEPMRGRVRDVFAEAEIRAPKLVVHTPWFATEA